MGTKTEVEEHANFDFSCPQIVKQLGLVRRVECSRGFEFEENLAIHNQVSIVLSNPSSAKPDWHWDFLSSPQSRFLQSHDQRLSVGGLKKSVPEFVVDVVEDPDDLLGQRGVLQARWSIHHQQVYAVALTLIRENP